MPISSFDPVTEQTRYERLLAEQEKEKDFKNRVDPVVAARVAEIYRKAPYIPASVILAMAKSGTSEQTIDGIRTTAAIKTARDLDPQKPKRKGWFQENIYDNVKAASRWTFAALNLLPDLAQNVASQAFSSNDEAGFDGWFKSTQLGTLMSNTQEAGEGWFLGDTAMEKQAERARRVRGTINGSAWTIGRGAAQVAFTPGSKPYSLLSGFVDAAVLLGTDPTLYAGKALKTAKTARAIIPGVSSAEDIENASRLARGAAGLGGMIGGALGSAGRGVGAAGSSVGGGLRSAAGSVGNAISGAAGAVGNAAKNAYGAAYGAVGDAGDAVKSSYQKHSSQQGVKQVMDRINGVYEAMKALGYDTNKLQKASLARIMQEMEKWQAHHASGLNAKDELLAAQRARRSQVGMGGAGI
jgi:hypothetical protein